MTDELPPASTRRSRLWQAAEKRHVPLQAILAAVAIVVLVYLAGKVAYRLRGVILLLVVAGFISLLLNPLVLLLQRWLHRRGLIHRVEAVGGLGAELSGLFPCSTQDKA